MRKRTLVLFLLGAVAIAFAAPVSADEDPALLQRAIDYETWLRDHHVPGYGGIVQIMFETEDLEKVLYYRGQGDSTMWTATYCAAESFRYAVTGDEDAKQNAIAAVETLRDHLRVTQTTGYIGRYVGPVNDPAYWLEYAGSDLLEYGTGPWLGTFYLSNSSSDQYVGWWHGLALAYDFIDDAPTRALIREMVKEVIDKLRNSAWLILNEEGLPTTAAPMIDGQKRLVFCLIAAHILDTAEYWDLYAEQFEKLAPTLPLTSIAFFNRYTEYFANNLRHQIDLNLFRLDDDPERLAVYWDLFSKQRRLVEWTHNVYFDYVYLIACEKMGQCAEAKEIMEDDLHSLTVFQDPPNREIHINCPQLPVDPVSVFLTDLAESLGLNDLLGFAYQAEGAQEITDRCRVEYLWQRTPHHLQCYGWLPQHVQPGVDYLIAYWMGRYYDFLEPHDIVDDDSADDDVADDDHADDDIADDDLSDDDADDDQDDDLDDDVDDDSNQASAADDAGACGC